jgi:hypothetical protein
VPVVEIEELTTVAKRSGIGTLASVLEHACVEAGPEVMLKDKPTKSSKRPNGA